MSFVITGGRNKDLFKILNISDITSNIEAIFLKYRYFIIEELTSNLHKHDKDQPGKLIQSIDVKVKTEGTNVRFTLSMEDYYKFVDEGVQGTEGSSITSEFKFKKAGKRIPLDSIKKFIAARGISPAQNIKRGKQLSLIKNKKIKKVIKKINKQKDLDNTAFAIGTSIKKHGIKPTYFFSDVINGELYTQMKIDIEKELGRTIELSFRA